MINNLAFPDFFPFSRPVIDETTIAEIGDCLRSGWLTTGPRVQELDQALKEYHQSLHAICVSSGTIGLVLALRCLELEPGDEVITTPMTFVSTLSSILHVGAKPVCVDIDPQTLNITPEAVEKAITPKTKAILPVHFAGHPLDLNGFYALAEKHHLTIIEDAAHASGAHYQGRKIGSFGHIQVLSFHPNKNMTTGEGGAILTQNEEWATKMRQLAFHGIDRTAWNRFGKNGQQNYDVTEVGYKGNMMDIQAILGLNQLKKLDDFVAKRRTLAQEYLVLLKGNPHLILPSEPQQPDDHGWHLFTIQVKKTSPLNRGMLMDQLKELNIGTGLHYQSCHRFKAIASQIDQTDLDLPESTRVGETILSLPLHPQMTLEHVHIIVHAINTLLNRA